MADDYYYARDGKRNGPVSLEALKDLALKDELKRQDRIWCKGMQGWQPAGSVDKLFDDVPPDLEDDALLQEPPPLPREESRGMPRTLPPGVTPSGCNAAPEIKHKKTSNRRHQTAAFLAMVGCAVGMKTFFDESGINWTSVIGLSAVMAVCGYFLGMLIESGKAPD